MSGGARFLEPCCNECTGCTPEDEEHSNRERKSERAVTSLAHASPVMPRSVSAVALVADTANKVREGMQVRGLTEGIDYTLDAGRVVWSAAHLWRRGWCCNHRCRNCLWRRT